MARAWFSGHVSSSSNNIQDQCLIVTDIYSVREKGVWQEIQYLTLKLKKKVYQLPSSSVPLYVELLAGKMLFRAPIAEDL